MKTQKIHLSRIFDVKEINKSVLRQYGVIIAIWAIVAFSLIILFGLYTYEMNKIYATSATVARAITIDGKQHTTETIATWRELLPHANIGVDQQTIYEAMVTAAFGSSQNLLVIGNRIPIIWFSCMLFIPNFSSVSDWQSVWETKLRLVTTAQIYILIADLLALVGLGFYLYLVIQYKVKLTKNDKMGCTNKYPLYKNNLSLYSTTVYVNFIIAISIFFSFYALSATVIMLIYMLIIKGIYKRIQKQNENKNISANMFNTSDLSYFKTLFIVMAVMIGYNLANSIVTSELNVDISSVLSGFFSAGGIAVVIVTLVKNLLDSSITQVKKKMKNIDGQIKELRFFYSIRKGEAAYDYTFAKNLPPLIKKIINENRNKLDTQLLKESFEKLFEYTDFVYGYKFSKSSIANTKNRNFILYRMYNEIEAFDEIEDIKVNLLKIQPAEPAK